MKQFVAILILTYLFACDGSSDNANLLAGREAITQYNARLQEAYIKGDAKTIGTLMTDSVVISPIGFPDIVSRDSVRNLLAGFFQGNTVKKYELRINEIEVYGNMAYERGTFVWESSGKDGSQMRSGGRYSAVRLKGEDGQWRVHRLIENQLPNAQ